MTEGAHARHLQDALRLARHHRDRAAWSRGELLAEQTAALRRLLAHAKAHVPFHAARLAGVDPERADVTSLARVAPVDKRAMLDAWDATVADATLTRARAEAHVAAIAADGEHRYLDARYTVLETSGTTGTRGVHVWDWDELALVFGSGIAFQSAVGRRLGLPPPTRRVSMAAAGPQHATAALAMIFQGPRSPFALERLPASLPFEARVAALERAPPDQLHAYPTLLPALLAETEAGRLDVRPRVVLVSSERSPPGLRARVASTWGGVLLDVWAATEALLATAPCEYGAIHVREDLVLLEPVDAAGRPVPPGETSAATYLTTLYAYAQPVIRYKLSDRVRFGEAPCPCGSAYAHIDAVEGREDPLIHLPGGGLVHPVALYDVLSRHAQLVEYRAAFVDARVVVELAARAPIDEAKLALELRAVLTRAGAGEVPLELRWADALSRGASGKLAPATARAV
jgi:phenylacetate-coenzyme A ligase PaaK-like adenylate-forming protein